MMYEIVHMLGYDSYYKGMYISKSDIKSINTVFNQEKKYYLNNYLVNSQSNFRNKYNVEIINNGKDLYGYSCTCTQFKDKKTCKHVAAVFYNYWSSIVNNEYIDEYIASKKIMKLFDEKVNDNNSFKKKINIDVEIDLSNSDKTTFRLKIGEDKLYILKHSNLDDFFNALNGGTFQFGKKFTYDSSKHYFDDLGKKILDFLKDANENKYNYHRFYYDTNPFVISKRELNYLFKLLNYENILITNYGRVNKVIYGFPTQFILSNDDNYSLDIDDFENYFILNNSSKYIIYNGNLYILNDEQADIISAYKHNKIKQMKFMEEDIPTFKSKILPRIKNNIKIDEKIQSIKLPVKPDVQFYFDLGQSLNCRVIFDYNGDKVNYFSKDLSDIRDLTYESSVVTFLINDNFTENDENFVIDDEDLYYDFIENKLSNYLEKYSVFLDKKIKTSTFKKNLSTTNNFSIGQDNILSYNFNVDGIDSDELQDIFNSLRQKKKYFKLKNNDILKLDENEEINELNNLITDLNLSEEDIISGNAQIPKYRAIYIDSLKNYKYHNIHTNNLFDDFINNFKKYQNTNIEFDRKDNEFLRDYQKDGAKWLKTIYKCDVGGILADEMGLGKSLQTIILIKEIIKEKEDAKILIVSPTSLVYNWQKEFEKFAPKLKFITLADTKTKRSEIFSKKDDYNIFITSYGLVRNDNDAYEDMNFELCVIDEAQAIKNYKANMTKEVKKINASCKIALTGTPVENNITEIWSIFDFIMPGYLNSVLKFHEKYKVKDIDDDAITTLGELKKQISPFILRRKKIDVAKSLPDKIEKNIYIELPLKQKKLYINELNKTKKLIDELISSGGFNQTKFQILSLLTKLRQLCIDPNVIYENYDGESAKIDELINIVETSIQNGHKILIFSSFKKVLNNVKSLFDKHSISSYIITGETKGKDRVQLVDAFNKDNTNCFLITLKSGGTGLNLTGADTVIHLDIWWNPQAENQATDRAHRIGQTKNVSVIKLITKGTIEEHILELQEKKKFLSDKLIENSDDNTLINKLTEKDIKKLLSFTDN